MRGLTVTSALATMLSVMDKLTLVGLAVLLAIGSIVGLLACRPGWGAVVERFRERISEAKAGSSQERLLEGAVVPRKETIRTPVAEAEAVAYATWIQQKGGTHSMSGTSGSNPLSVEDLRVQGVAFDLDTGDGVVPVAGKIVGVSDLVRRKVKGLGQVEAFIAPGDHVSVLGELSERDGQRGFFGDVIVVKGTFDDFYEAVQWGTLPSIPVRAPSAE